MTIWRNGQFSQGAPLCSPPREVNGVLTTAGCDGGRVYLWEQHRRRLLNYTQLAIDEHSLPSQEDLQVLLKTSGCLSAARMRVSVWQESVSMDQFVEATCFSVESFGSDQEPVWLGVVRWQDPPAAGHKIIARCPWQDAGVQAVSWGADDALIADSEGRLLETSKANIFVRRGSMVATPPAPDRCLPGIMREVVIEALPLIGLKTEVRDIFIDELTFADEVWITNAVIGVVRVGRIGERRWDRWDFHQRLAMTSIPAPGWPR